MLFEEFARIFCMLRRCENRIEGALIKCKPQKVAGNFVI